MKQLKNAKEFRVKDRARNCTPRGIVTLRWKRLHLSQALFARIMGVSKQTVNSWECGWRVPSMMAKQFLYFLDENPAMIADLVVRRGGRDD